MTIGQDAEGFLVANILINEEATKKKKPLNSPGINRYIQ